MLSDMPFEISAKIFHRGFQWIRCARRKRAEGATRGPHFGLRRELFEIAGLSVAVFHGLENALRPSKATPARRAKPAGFASEKTHQVPRHADRTGLIVEHDHGA